MTPIFSCVWYKRVSSAHTELRQHQKNVLPHLKPHGLYSSSSEVAVAVTFSVLRVAGAEMRRSGFKQSGKYITCDEDFDFQLVVFNSL